MPDVYGFLVLGAFVGSVVWMDMCAAEMVALMEAAGVALGMGGGTNSDLTPPNPPLPLSLRHAPINPCRGSRTTLTTECR